MIRAPVAGAHRLVAAIVGSAGFIYHWPKLSPHRTTSKLDGYDRSVSRHAQVMKADSQFDTRGLNEKQPGDGMNFPPGAGVKSQGRFPTETPCEILR